MSTEDTNPDANLTERDIQYMRRLVVKRVAKIEKIKARIAADHPQKSVVLTVGPNKGQTAIVGPKPETLDWNDEHQKYSVEVLCPNSGVSHRRFTSDLHHAQVHPDYKKTKSRSKSKGRASRAKVPVFAPASGDSAGWEEYLNALYKMFETVSQPSDDILERTVTVAGCDVGVSKVDTNTGLTILRHTPGRPIEILDNPRTRTASQALKDVPALMEKYSVDYLVVDAPLLPVYTGALPPGHFKRNGTQSYFRPLETMIRGLPHDLMDTLLSGVTNGMKPDKAYNLSNRIQPFPTWSKGQHCLAPFAQTARELLAALPPRMQLIRDFGSIQPCGVMEGFPKAFYAPMLQFTQPFELYADSNRFPRGTIDEAIIRYFLNIEYPERFWTPSGLEAPQKGPLWTQALENPDVACATSMAVQGLLYSRGRAMALAARMNDQSTDFGHILSVSTDLFSRFGFCWLQYHMTSSRVAFPNATVSIFNRV